VKEGERMYVPVIIIGLIGLLFLVINIICFLRDYSLVINNKLKKTLIVANIVGMIGSVSLIILSVVYFILINNQL